VAENQNKKNDPFQGTTLGKDVAPEHNIDVDQMIRDALEESKRAGEVHSHHHHDNNRPEKGAEILPVSPPPMHIPKIEEDLKATPLTQPVVPTARPLVPAPSKGTFAESYERTFKLYKVGDVVRGVVTKIDPTGVFVDIAYKSEGFIPPEKLSDRHFASAEEIVHLGEEIHARIENMETKDGYILLNKRVADYEIKWREAFDAYKTKKVLQAKVTSVVRGGLVVDCNGIKGFIPASQVAKRVDDPLDQFVGKVLPIKILEIDRRQGKVILSHKVAHGEIQREESSKILDELEVGQVRKGRVTNVKNYGAFVDVGGIEGLLHVSEMSWKKLKTPNEKVAVGQELDVFILGVDRVKGKVALGLRQLEPDPWVQAAEIYKAGQIVEGKIVRLVRFGAFAELANGIEGLIHISELSWDPIARPEDVVKPGDQVTLKILRVLPDEQKIGLSLKAVRSKVEASIGSGESGEAKTSVTVEDMLKSKSENEGELQSE